MASLPSDDRDNGIAVDNEDDEPDDDEEEELKGGCCGVDDKGLKVGPLLVLTRFI